jgi:hypothetical protein
VEIPIEFLGERLSCFEGSFEQDLGDRDDGRNKVITSNRVSHSCKGNG